MARPPRQKAAKAPPPTHNSDFSKEQIETIRKASEEIVQLENQREQINAAINLKRKSIKAAGCNLDAWRAQKRRAEMDTEKREDFDRSAIAASQALGVPIQGGLFDDDADGDEDEAGGLPGANEDE
jgi:hypothetical protein